MSAQRGARSRLARTLGFCNRRPSHSTPSLLRRVARCVFADHPQVLVGDYLADIIDSNEIHFFHCTPSVLSTLPADRHVPSLRIVSVGVEASPPGLLGHWRKRAELPHAYGPTETR